jgi:hypothetical protein
MTKTAARKLNASLVGTEIATPAGNATCTGVWTAKGQTWVGYQIVGGGFGGGLLKSAVRIEDFSA